MKRLIIWSQWLVDKLFTPTYRDSNGKKIRIVCADNWKGYAFPFKKILRDLLPIVGRDVVLHVIGGHQPSVDDGNFNVYVDATPLETGIKRTDQNLNLALVFHVQEADAIEIREASPFGKPVGFDNLSAAPIGELVGNHSLYVYGDVRRLPKNSLAQTLREICYDVDAAVRIPQAKRLLEDQQRLLVHRHQQRKALLEAMCPRDVSQLKEIEDQIVHLEGRIMRLQIDAEETSMTYFVARELCVAEETRNAEIVQASVDRWEELRAHPKIRDVWLEDNALKVRTEALTCRDPHTEQDHSIGDFVITLFLDGANGVLNFKKAQTVDLRNGIYHRMQAPNVSNDGRPISSQALEPMIELLCEGEDAVAIDMAIQYLENPDADCPSSHYVKQWPLAIDTERQ
jgi:hypothetical protein